MAFKKSMPPVRILLVLGIGLAGGMFFWSLQSRLRWGLFGTMVSVVLTHCIVEIIYHFDFKKMFCHRLQLGLCLAAGILVFLSFRYDWYGYDSYIPSKEKIVSPAQPALQRPEEHASGQTDSQHQQYPDRRHGLDRKSVV